MPKTEKTVYRFELDRDLAELLDRYCAEVGITPQAVIEDLVVEFLEDMYLTEES